MDIKAYKSRNLTFSRTSLDFGQFCGAGGWCDGMRPSWETCGGGYRDTCSQSARNLTSRQSAFQECNTSQIIFSLSLSRARCRTCCLFFGAIFSRAEHTWCKCVLSVCSNVVSNRPCLTFLRPCIPRQECGGRWTGEINKENWAHICKFLQLIC